MSSLSYTIATALSVKQFKNIGVAFSKILNTVMNLTWEDSKCSACNYEGMCDENNDCVEGMSEYVYKKIKGEIL